jgi:hypothetical protein
MLLARLRLINNFSFIIFFFCFTLLNAAAPYDESLKSTSSSSVIIPTPIHERENEKYNNNNNNHNNINNNLLSPSSHNVALKIEDVSNETQSNSMIAEDHHQRPTTQTAAATRWGFDSYSFHL